LASSIRIIISTKHKPTTPYHVRENHNPIGNSTVTLVCTYYVRPKLKAKQDECAIRRQRESAAASDLYIVSAEKAASSWLSILIEVNGFALNKGAFSKMRCACTMVCVHHIYPPTAFVENNSQLNML
jgi:hypothetical protein